MPQDTAEHIPVLLQEVTQYLAPQPGERYLDLTAGYGGHAQAILEKTQKPTAVCLVDRDPQAIVHLQRFSVRGARLIQTDFATASQQLVDEGREFDMILADLGVS